jgi:processive 1,2-diacylglycerol beta-glucosyltransferase
LGSAAIDLVYLSVGSGHQMAARAIGEGLHALAPQVDVDIFDPLARKTPFTPGLGNLGLMLAMRYGGKVYEEKWKKGGSPLVGWAARQPWVVRHSLKGGLAAATHVFSLRMALAHRERFAVPRKVYGVVTDFGLHGFWPLEDVDGYFVSSDDLRDELVERGFPASKVVASGFPLRLDFAAGETWQPRRAGGPLRVLILAGGVMSGAYMLNLAWFQELFEVLRVSPLEVRFTIVTGNRARLQTDLKPLVKKSRFEVYLRGMVGDMAGVMRSHDLMVAKPGGASVAEALACGLPLAALRPGPGQETANRAFLQRHDVWNEAYTPGQLAEVITRAVQDETWLYEMARRCKALGKPAATLEVARWLLKDLQ